MKISFGVAATAVLGGRLMAHKRAKAQECGGASLIWYYGEWRISGNEVAIGIGTAVWGDESDYWEIYLDGYSYINGYMADIDRGQWAGFGEFGEYYSLADNWYYEPSGYGPGSYAESADNEWDSEDCGDWANSYNDTESGGLTVNQPTVTGFLTPAGGFWNLGPGTSDPQITSGGVYYYQS